MFKKHTNLKKIQILYMFPCSGLCNLKVFIQLFLKFCFKNRRTCPFYIYSSCTDDSPLMFLFSFKIDSLNCKILLKAQNQIYNILTCTYTCTIARNMNVFDFFKLVHLKIQENQLYSWLLLLFFKFNYWIQIIFEYIFPNFTIILNVWQN